MFAKIDYDYFTVSAVTSIGQPPVNAPAVKITSVTNSSLEVQPGSLFVPLADKRDGHDFIADAFRRGAVASFVRAGHPVIKTLPAVDRIRLITVDDPLIALGKLAAFHRRRFAPLVIAVTGSNGKTTTKEMLAQIFRAHLGRACIATEKNYNNHIGLPFTLFAIGTETRSAILEMGMNHAGEISYLSQLALPHLAVISSIGHAHIEFFRSRAGIAAAKSEIIDGMLPGGALYVPKMIAELPTVAAATKRRKILLHKINPAEKNSTALKIVSQSASGFQLAIGQERIFFPFA
ncbi:MAG: UDP-N-acetylmuramoyl-tripeptide--D-alanyl-D-alanine ligase, partial [Turneriella sp.]